MLRKLLFLILIIYTSSQLQAQNWDSSAKRISILFIGDIMGHDEQIWSAENRENGTYNYDDVFKYVKDEISEADIAFANLEVTLAGPPYGYRGLGSPDELAVSKKCRNRLFSLNNHSADREGRGLSPL
jgi:poly-gamma-glutamate synthesis protein (capsule biosynthesis protein)